MTDAANARKSINEARVKKRFESRKSKLDALKAEIEEITAKQIGDAKLLKDAEDRKSVKKINNLLRSLPEKSPWTAEAVCEVICAAVEANNTPDEIKNVIRANAKSATNSPEDLANLARKEDSATNLEQKDDAPGDPKSAHDGDKRDKGNRKTPRKPQSKSPEGGE